MNRFFNIIFNPPSRNSPPLRMGMDSEENSASARFSLRRSEKKESTGVRAWCFKILLLSAVIFTCTAGIVSLSEEIRLKAIMLPQPGDGGGGAIGNWTLQGNTNLYPNEITYKVGIGRPALTNPNAQLQINGSITRQGSTVAQLYNHVNLGVNSKILIANNRTCAIGGGYLNTIEKQFSFIGGGKNNKTIGQDATIAGGELNYIGDAPVGVFQGIISGGYKNTINRMYSNIAGGRENTIADLFFDYDAYAAIAGGYLNTAGGRRAFVAGGKENTANGNCAWAGGYRAAALNNGSFVWASWVNDTQARSNDNGAYTFNVYAKGFYFNGGCWPADIAEFMSVLKKDGIKEAELVSLKGNDLLARTEKPYDENLIGVISGERTRTLHLGNSEDPDENIEKLPVALAGRCFVKVTNEAGPIKVGDPITSSSTPGSGMKADKTGKIIGYAMEEEDFKDKDRGEVLTFLNIGYYASFKEYARLASKIKSLEERMASIKRDRLSQPKISTY